jgi:hypothetical protein
VEQYNKATAAVLAGAVVTLLIAVIDAFGPAIAPVMKQPSVQAALQTILTAVAVYFAPANKGPGT